MLTPALPPPRSGQLVGEGEVVYETTCRSTRPHGGLSESDDRTQRGWEDTFPPYEIFKDCIDQCTFRNLALPLPCLFGV